LGSIDRGNECDGKRRRLSEALGFACGITHKPGAWPGMAKE